MTDGIKILHEPKDDEPFVVLHKRAGLPSAPLSAFDHESAFSQCARLFPKVKSVKGKKEIEGGLLHRIDTATGGLLLIASSQEFYDHISAAQEKGLFVKVYSAVCSLDIDNGKKMGGFPELPQEAPFSFLESDGDFFSKPFSFEAASYFRHYGKGKKEVRPVLASSSAAAVKKVGEKKLYSTKMFFKKIQGGQALVECKIALGFRHQVRCHLAWLGFPVDRDRLYNFEFLRSPKNEGPMRFEAVSLEFPGMNGDGRFSFSCEAAF